MDSSETLKKVLFWSIALGVVAIILPNRIKKLRQRVKNIEEEEEKLFKSSGISTEELKKNIEKEETDFVKMFFVSSVHNPRFESDIFNINYLCDGEDYEDKRKDLDARYNQTSMGVVHIKQRTNMGKRFLSFELDIPTAFENNERYSYNYPKFNVFREAILGLRKKLGEDLEKMTQFPRIISRINCKCKILYTTVNENGEANEGLNCFVVPETVYCKNGREDWDKLNEFSKNELKNMDAANEKKERYIPDWFIEASKLKREQVYSLEDIETCFALTFPIRSTNPGEEIGIDLVNATECLNFIVNEFSVIRGEKRSNNLEYLYRHVVFHPVDENGNSIEENCYEIGEDGKIKNTWLYY